MPVTLPLVTRREIAREFRPDGIVTDKSALRTLREHGALSEGVSIETRAGEGHFGGRLYLYSSLNRDAARMARQGEYARATKIAKCASKLEATSECRHLTAALRKTMAGPDMTAIARALSHAELAPALSKLQLRIHEARTSLQIETDMTALPGRIAAINEAIVILKLHGAVGTVPVPRPMVEGLGDLIAVGTAVSALWETLPGGRSLFTVEPAIDVPELNEHGESLVDMYETPWGKVLTANDSDALKITGEPTIAIPGGIPDVE